MIDSAEFSALVAEHAVWLTAFLRGLTACEADAEDAFQDVWLRVLRGCGPDNPRALRGYLAKIARSVVIDRYRRNWRMALMVDDAESALKVSEIETSAPDPAQTFESAATHEEVLAAVRSLPEGPRTVVLMRIEGELSFQEIADILEVPLGTVLTWMRRATTHLKTSLEGK